MAINSKYIHSNPAVYDLRAYTIAHFFEDCDTTYPADAKVTRSENMPDILIREYTINQPLMDIARDIYRNKPDVLAFSCYIWNIETVSQLLGILHKIMPDVPIWLGGPEVSYDVAKDSEVARNSAKHPLNFDGNSVERSMNSDGYSDVRGIICGEGEKSFCRLVRAYACGQQDDLPHVLYPDSELSMDDLPFPYEDTEPFRNRIIYYETSRGCPYACSYCLSAGERLLGTGQQTAGERLLGIGQQTAGERLSPLGGDCNSRIKFRSLSLVYKELQHFLDARVPLVKFVDRTFNCNHAHAMGIWEYLSDHDNGVTTFHFEIAGEILTEEEIALLSTLRKGLVQLEIGVQTVNSETLRAICRASDPGKLRRIVAKLLAPANIHIHLDLIAGLPFENLASFRHSFDEVYSMGGHDLQLGFLKLLKGSPLYERAQEYGIVCSDCAPYEVLYTKWLSFDDILLLKSVEEMVEVYHNSLQFMNTMAYLESRFDSPFCIYEELAVYYRGNGLDERSHNRFARYEILRDWWLDKHPEDDAVFTEILLTDMYLRENVKNRPAYGKNGEVVAREYRMFFENRGYEEFLHDYADYSPTQVSHMVHIEKVGAAGHILFDYRERNPITGNATTYYIEEKDWRRLCNTN